jgi:hypothetical protein
MMGDGLLASLGPRYDLVRCRAIPGMGVNTRNRVYYMRGTEIHYCVERVKQCAWQICPEPPGHFSERAFGANHLGMTNKPD